MRRSTLLTAFLPIALLGCGDDELAAPDTSRASLMYRYEDSSVPPEYHRSYTLQLEANGEGAAGQLVVDAYGDELHQVDVEVEPARWDEAIIALVELRPSSSDGEGCTGGTGREVRVGVDGDEIVAADVEVCGDDGAGDADAIDEIIAPLLDDLDMETLLASG